VAGGRERPGPRGSASGLASPAWSVHQTPRGKLAALAAYSVRRGILLATSRRRKRAEEASTFSIGDGPTGDYKQQRRRARSGLDGPTRSPSDGEEMTADAKQ
jgi:hypothetical protein